MMRQISMRLVMLMLGASVLVLVGCMGLGIGKGTTTPTKFYVLNSLYSSEQKIPPVTEIPDISIGVGPVRIPQHLDRPQIVTRTDQNELMMEEFAQWGEPLRVNIARVLAENLSILLATDQVAIFPWLKSSLVDYQVTVEVTRFDGSPGENALLRARWAIFGKNGKKMLLLDYSNFSEPTGSDDIQTMVAAISRTVENLSREIAKAIKSLKEGKAAAQ
jgi:uncharacterized lipoprotein YmbA